MSKIVGIIGAMDEEVASLIETMEKIDQKEKAGLLFHHGFINNCECVVVKAGIGKVNAAMCTSILLTLYQIDYVINTGVAGGLTTNYNVKIGDIIVSTDALQHDFDVTGFGFELGMIPRMDNSVFVASEYLRKVAMNSKEVLKNSVNVYEGRVLSGDQFISDKEKIEFLAKTFNGDCVEMEGASIAHVCYLNNVEYLVIRAISDSADSSAEMTYQEFEKQAAINSALLTEKMLTTIGCE